jgi:hypothetical protein
MMVEDVCHEIYALFLSDAKTDVQQRRAKTNTLVGYCINHAFTFEALQHVCALERKLVTVKGTHKAFVEGQLFFLLNGAALDCLPDETTSTPVVALGPALPHEQRTAHQRHCDRTARYLVNFLDEMFAVTLPRDTLSTTRKAQVLEVLTTLSYAYEIPEAYAMSLQCLKSRKRASVMAACEYLKAYCTHRGVPLKEEAVHLLEKLATQAKTRDMVTSVLDVQVQLGRIGELSALSQLDQWKQHHEPW